MLYETAWMFFVLGIGIFLSIGLLGLIFSLSTIVGRKIKDLALILSLLIIIGGIYFSYRWYDEKKEIQVLAQQVEQAVNQYLTAHKK